MRGNFSRLTRGGGRRIYRSVIQQQGRVLLDSDWNDLVALFERELRVRTQMLVGETGTDGGFRVRPQCGLLLNAGGTRDGQYGQSVMLKPHRSLPFRRFAVDHPYTIELAFRVLDGEYPGEHHEHVLLQLPGRWSVRVNEEACLVLHLADGTPPQRIGQVERKQRFSLVLSYDGQETLYTWLRSGDEPAADSDERLHPGWSARPQREGQHQVARGGGEVSTSLVPEALDGARQVQLSIGGDHESRRNTHAVLEGLWIWDATIERLPSRGHERVVLDECKLVCALDLSSIETGAVDPPQAVIADRSGKGNRGFIRTTAELPPVRLMGATIGAGCYAVDGLVVENCEPVAFADQPFGANEFAERAQGSAEATTHAWLYYLEVWERFVSALQVPQLVEPALAGPDTTGRMETVWQVRVLQAREPSELEQRWCVLNRYHQQRGRAKFTRALAGTGRADNLLYRVEVHTPGWALSTENSRDNASRASVEKAAAGRVRVSDPNIARLLMPGSQVALTSDDFRTSQLATVTHVVDAGLIELSELPPVIEGLRLRPIATFKWSRNNAQVACAVRSVEPVGSHWRFILENEGYNGFDVQVNNWLELGDEELDLARRGGHFFRVIDISSSGSRTSITAAHLLHGYVGELGTLPVLRLWGGEPQHRPPLHRVTDQTTLLEDAVEVTFSADGFFASSDWWVVPLRDQVGIGLLWPSDELLPPQGITTHVAKLAELQTRPGQFESKDLRKLFMPLTTLTRLLDSPRSSTAPELRGPKNALVSRARAGQSSAIRVLSEYAVDLSVQGFVDTAMCVTRRAASASTWRDCSLPNAPSGRGSALSWCGRTLFVGMQALWIRESTQWTRRSESTQRVDCASVACGHRLWVFGGHTGRDTTPIDSVLYLDDPRTGAWTKQRELTLPEPASGLAAAVLAGRIHVIGGGNADAVLGSHRVLDPRTRQWRALAALLTPRRDFALVAYAGQLFAFGGRDADGNLVSSIECYHPDSDSWVDLQPSAAGEAAPPACADLAAIAVDEGIVITGGDTGDAISVKTYLLRPGPGSWQPLSPLNSARACHGLAIIAGEDPDTCSLLALGGTAERAVATEEAFALSASLRIWRRNSNTEAET